MRETLVVELEQTALAASGLSVEYRFRNPPDRISCTLAHDDAREEMTLDRGVVRRWRGFTVVVTRLGRDGGRGGKKNRGPYVAELAIAREATADKPVAWGEPFSLGASERAVGPGGVAIAVVELGARAARLRLSRPGEPDDEVTLGATGHANSGALTFAREPGGDPEIARLLVRPRGAPKPLEYGRPAELALDESGVFEDGLVLTIETVREAYAGHFIAELRAELGAVHNNVRLEIGKSGDLRLQERYAVEVRSWHPERPGLVLEVTKTEARGFEHGAAFELADGETGRGPDGLLIRFCGHSHMHMIGSRPGDQWTDGFADFEIGFRGQRDHLRVCVFDGKRVRDREPPAPDARSQRWRDHVLTVEEGGTRGIRLTVVHAPPPPPAPEPPPAPRRRWWQIWRR